MCDEDWRPALAQSLFFVGSMVGSPSLGWAADAWGRLPIIVFSNLLGAVAGIASAFSSSFVMFAALRFIVGLTYEQHYIIAYILRECLADTISRASKGDFLCGFYPHDVVPAAYHALCTTCLMPFSLQIEVFTSSFTPSYTFMPFSYVILI